MKGEAMARQSFREDSEYARLEKRWAETVALEEDLQEMMANPQEVGTPDLREVLEDLKVARREQDARWDALMKRREELIEEWGLRR